MTAQTTQSSLSYHFKLDKYIITYDSSITVEEFDCEWYYGIIFYMPDGKYELIHNYALGNRIFINNREGWRDIPFKPATFDFLPPGVEAKEMNNEEKQYLNLLKNILDTGSTRTDRTGVGTIGTFGTTLRFSLENNKVPMLTTKKMFLKGVVEELLFFLRGDTDSKKLEAKGVNIWKGNTTREFLDKRGLHHLPEGDMGKGYGFQWRKFGQISNCDNGYCLADGEGVDQLKQVIHTLKTNPTDRRIIISAWNPQQLPQTALPPCHMMVQFYVNDNKLSAQFYMRSVDTFLGLPFNLLSYAILTRIIAQTVGMEPGELIFVGGDTHIYSNHVEQVKEQLSREPFQFPTLLINKELKDAKDIEELQLADFKIEGYESHPSIKAEMAV